MPLDASIIGRGFQTKSPFQQYAELAQVQGAMNQSKLANLQLQQAEAGAQKQSRLQQLLQQEFADPAAREGALLKQGFVDESLKLGKDRREGAKLENESLRAKSAAEKDALETAAKKIAMTTQVLSAAKDPQSYMQGRQFLQANGIDVSGSPEQFDPAWVANSLQQGQSIQERLAQVWKQKGYDLDVSKFDEAKRSNRVSEGLTVRGQNLTDARARERLTFEKGNAVADAGGPEQAALIKQLGKPPAGYRWKTDGALEPIPGGPAGKASQATEGERTAATLLKRLEFSEKQLEKAVTEKPSAATPNIVAQGLRAAGADPVANAVTSQERQRIEAAQLDILDAALTLGTGAAYTREQLEGYRRSYFPQINDKPETVKDKAARLQNVIDAAKIKAGRAAPQGGATGDFGAPDMSAIDAEIARRRGKK